MQVPNKITVVYLVWLPYGINLFKNFIQSYLSFNAGLNHQLALLFNGTKNPIDIESYCTYAEKYNVKFSVLTLEKGYDIDAYFFAAKNIECDLFFFINTYSVLLNDNWLKKMYDNIVKENVGMVSATGTLQSHSSSPFMSMPFRYQFSKKLKYNYRKYKLFIKSAIYWKVLFEGFPNPHLRTNAFMIWKNIFLEIKYKPITSKMRAYEFESGRNSITNQILHKKKKVLVVDKFGIGYEIKNWYGSKIFWENDQENLMISDNQTTKYINADETEKKLYTYLAWGEK